MTTLSLEYLYDLIRRHKHDDVESTKMNNGVERIDVSFETGEQATLNLYVPFGIKITRIRARTTKAIAATDDGTVTIKTLDSDGTTLNTLATLTFPASTGIDTNLTALEGATLNKNNIVGKNHFYQLAVAKTTAGGKAIISIEWERL